MTTVAEFRWWEREARQMIPKMNVSEDRSEERARTGASVRRGK